LKLVLHIVAALLGSVDQPKTRNDFSGVSLVALGMSNDPKNLSVALPSECRRNKDPCD